jgi:hypothetical protein
MKIRIKSICIHIGILFLILICVSSAGCIKQVQGAFGGDTGLQTTSPVPGPAEISPPSEVIADKGNFTITPTVVTPTPLPVFHVDEVNPQPYITPDPYRLPYRDFSNRTGNASDTSVRIPQFTRNLVLRSNSTAFRVNVIQAPFIIDLTFSPLFDNPDQTGDSGSSYPSDDEESSDESSDGGSGELSGEKSFVYSNAEIIIINTFTNETVATEGYGGIYSSDTEKTIRIYQEGPYIVALTGNFIDVNLKITTSSPELPATPVPYSYATSPEEEENW